MLVEHAWHSRGRAAAPDSLQVHEFKIMCNENNNTNTNYNNSVLADLQCSVNLLSLKSSF